MIQTITQEIAELHVVRSNVATARGEPGKADAEEGQMVLLTAAFLMFCLFGQIIRAFVCL